MTAPFIPIEPAPADEGGDYEGFTIRDAVIAMLTAGVACAIAFGIVLVLGAAFMAHIAVAVP